MSASVLHVIVLAVVACVWIDAAAVKPQDVGNALKALLDTGVGADANIGGCGLSVTLPKSCAFTIAPQTADNAKCAFPALGAPLLMAELGAMTTGGCQGLDVTMLTKPTDGERQWALGLHHDANRTGASGYIREIPVEQIVGSALDLFGFDMADLGFPLDLSNVGVIAYKKKAGGIWLGLSGTHENCASSVVTRTFSEHNGVAVSAGCTGMELADFLKKHAGAKNAESLDFLESVGFTAVLSSMQIDKVDSALMFNNSDLVHMAVPQGLLVTTSLKTPQKCRTAFCKFLNGILEKGNALVLSGSVAKGPSFAMSAAVPFDLPISDNARMKEIVVLLDPTTAALEMNIELDKPKLMFSGSISTGAHGFGVQASMAGVWERAFGFSHISFGNVLLGATFAPPDPVPTSFDVGADLLLGLVPEKGQKDERIEAEAFVGLDSVDEKQNYFYGKLDLTVGRLLKAFGLEKEAANLPQDVAETGFPKGIIASYTANPAGKHLKQFDITIPSGMYMKGELDLFGLTATALVDIVESPMSVFVNVSLPPLKLGGVAAFRASADASGGGANGLVRFSAGDPLSGVMDFSGYVELFGFYRFGRLLVDRRAFNLTSQGNLYGFDSDVEVVAEYGSISAAKFHAHAEIKNCHRLKKLTEKLRKKMEVKLDEGKVKIEAAEAEVKRAQEDCFKKLNTDCDKCVKTTQAADSFCENIVEKPCKVFCFSNGKCKLKCENTADKCTDAIVGACRDACKAVNTIGTGLCHVVDVATGVLELAEKADGAIVKVSRAGMQAFEIFSINIIMFDTVLGTQEGPEFNCVLDVIVLKKHFRVEVNLNLDELSKEDDDKEADHTLLLVYEDVKNKF